MKKTIILKILFCFFIGVSTLSAQNQIPQPGEKFPDFSFETPDGHIAKIQDFKGKYVYIDVWASWCSACLAAKPRVQWMKEELAGKNIVFVSISIDSDIAAWKNAIKTKNLSGVMLRCEEDAPFVKSFDIRAVPRFMLIDKDGIIVNSMMSHPASLATIETLKRLEGMSDNKK